MYGFCPRCVSWCSGKCKISLKSVPHISKGWPFWGDESALRVLICDAPLQMLRSEGASLSSTLCQQPEIKEVMVKYMLTLLRRGKTITNVTQHIKGSVHETAFRKSHLEEATAVHHWVPKFTEWCGSHWAQDMMKQILFFFFCSHATWHVGWESPKQGLKQCPLQCNHRVLTTGPLRKICQ